MSMSSMSDYFKKLEAEHPDVARHYVEKIEVINNVDPFSLTKEQLGYTKAEFPPIEAFDIAAHLVTTHSYYTKEQMRAHKSLDAYKFFEAGFVRHLGVRDINGYKVVVGKVRHSQRTTLPPLSTWIICKSDGSVMAAHCTCIAGNSEVCSHVGAILYNLESIRRETASTTSCTDVPAAWKVPKVDGGMESLRGIHGHCSTRPQSPVTASERDEMVGFLRKVETIGGTCGVMRVLNPFASEIFSESIQSEIKPTYSDLYNPAYKNMSLTDLVEITEAINLSITVADCDIIFGSTLLQSKCDDWFAHRRGRITASRFANACKTSLERPSLTTIKTICYPVEINFKIDAIQWGRLNEKNALAKYEAEQKKEHEHFVCEPSGLIINPQFVQFAASPDALSNCSCCGKGCVEVKCPFLLKDMQLTQYLLQKNSCLERAGNTLQLKRNHNYYYQVQLQMKVSGRSYCDFVVWSRNDYVIERIHQCEEFWNKNYEIAKTFHDKIIMPELVAKYYTENINTTDLWCICKMRDDGLRTMIECGNSACETKWFHLDCVGLSTVPDYVWLCGTCQ